MKRNKVISQLLIILAIVVAVNLISEQLYLRLDFTGDKQYTLSKATRDILRDLEDVITVTAYYSEDLPPQLMTIKKDFNDLLIEYENRSDGNVVFEFVNPNRDEQEEMKAQQAGISPIMVNVTERDQVKQMRAYMGAVLQMGEKVESIPVLQPGAGMEYALTTSIKKLASTNKAKVAFLQGHGEPPMYASAQVLEALSVLYETEEYTLTDTADIPMYYRTVVMIDPKDSIPASHFAKLDKYLTNGGRLFLAYSPLQAELNRGYLGTAPDIGVKSWLAGKGITLYDHYLVDASCGSVSVRQQQGPFIMNTQVQFPYFPIVSNFSDHPSVEGLESLFLAFVSSITYLPLDSAMNIQPLAYTSDNSGIIPAPNMVDINKNWTQDDFRSGKQVVAISANGPIGGSGDSRMIVIAHGSFAVNGEGPQPQQVNQDNVNFEVNAIDWLSDDTGLIDLRTKGVTNRPLDQVEDSKKAILKYANFIVPILIALVIGFSRRQNYLRKKQKWIQGTF